MSLAVIGGLVGLVFGVVEYWMFGMLIARAVSRGDEGPGPRALDLARKAQLVLFPLMGVVVGAVLGDGNGVTG